VFCSAEFSEGFTEPGIGVVRDLPGDRATAELDHCLGVDGFGGGFVLVLASSDSNIAGKQRTELRFGREGAAGPGCVAGTRD
jgi:hypothetical protein